MREWEKNIRRVVPYVPGDQPNGEHLVKLNTNENPYPPSPGVSDALAVMDYEQFRKYPDPASTGLVKALADYYHVEENQVFVGVGSDDVIAMAFMTFFNSEKPILFPDVSYSFYPVWAQLFHIPYEMPKLDGEFHIRTEDYFRENGGIIFPNPNAPTGLYLELDRIRELIACNQSSVVIIDEAYIDFGGKSALPLLKEYDNLLIIQTFSKSRSMAGLRIGFAIGHPDLIQAMNDVKYSYNSYTMNLPSQLLGIESIREDRYFKETTARIIRTREESKERFRKLGFTFPDSMANFIFVSHPQCRAKELFEWLRREQIYVRYFQQPRLLEYLRITVGTDEQMDRLFEKLEYYILEKSKK